MQLISRKIPFYYNSVCYKLFLEISRFGLKEGYKKILKEYKFNFENYSPYLEIVSGYMNDYNEYELFLNPDYFNFLELDKFNSYEKKIIIILAASMRLRMNKPIFELIYKKIIDDEKIDSKYSYIIAKYILKYKFSNNREYVLKNILSEVFGNHILYKLKKDWILYVPDFKNKEKIKLLKYIQKYFVKNNENIKVYWGKHFFVLGNKEISIIDKQNIF